MGGGRKHPPQHFAPVAAGRLRAGDAASDRPQSHRPRGADNAVTPSLRANGSRECAPDDRLREAIHSAASGKLDCFVASLLAMTAIHTPARPTMGNNPACPPTPCP